MTGLKVLRRKEKTYKRYKRRQDKSICYLFETRQYTVLSILYYASLFVAKMLSSQVAMVDGFLCRQMSHA